MRRYWTRTEGRNDEVCWANSFSGRVRTDSKDPSSGLRIDADLVPFDHGHLSATWSFLKGEWSERFI